MMINLPWWIILSSPLEIETVLQDSYEEKDGIVKALQ